jgi:hypothetical protein
LTNLSSSIFIFNFKSIIWPNIRWSTLLLILLVVIFVCKTANIWLVLPFRKVGVLINLTDERINEFHCFLLKILPKNKNIFIFTTECILHLTWKFWGIILWNIVKYKSWDRYHAYVDLIFKGWISTIFNEIRFPSTSLYTVRRHHSWTALLYYVYFIIAAAAWYKESYPPSRYRRICEYNAPADAKQRTYPGFSGKKEAALNSGAILFVLVSESLLRLVHVYCTQPPHKKEGFLGVQLSSLQEVLRPFVGLGAPQATTSFLKETYPEGWTTE